MNDRPTPQLASRKQPKQARSTELVASILEAAAQVLATEGARRFTAARVAERAGVSVGSLYQYFPNKAAIIFRLQHDEWRDTTAMLARLLLDPERSPPERLRAAVHAFQRSECAEAAMRTALHDAAPLYRDAPEAEAAQAAGGAAVRAFLAEALPHAPEATRALAGDLIKTTLGAVGQAFSESPRTDAEIHAYAEALADMLTAYLRSLGSGG